MTDLRRAIPSMDRLLESTPFQELQRRFPRERVTRHLRAALDRVRDAAGRGEPPPPADAPALYASEVARGLAAEETPSLRPVINATGVILHTNLGRAPLADAARRAMDAAAAGYSNLEFDLERGGRGSRYVHCVDLLTGLTGAEGALVVNNNAAALVLALNTLARGAPVLVSRGELVEIGGGFRIPEMLERAGARLVEVGSTNRTRLDDYRRAAVDTAPALVLKVHRSNFRITGFTEEASLGELSAWTREAGVPLVHDLGSGLLADPEALGLPPEPRAVESLEAGADVVALSGDKLLGGPQAGILLGRAELVARMRSNPLCRALRVDKATLAALEATLRLYRDPAAALREVPALRMLGEPVEALEARARALASAAVAAGFAAEARPGLAVVGGGTCPGVEIPSWTVRLDPMEGGGGAEGLAGALRRGDPPVVGRVEDGRVVLDLRTVAPGEDERVADRLREVAGRGAPSVGAQAARDA